jgi:hypothetical protein
MSKSGPRYARRTDDNHAEIRDDLRDVPGVYCKDVSGVPNLGFDLIVNFRGGRPLFVEVKRPNDPAPLTPAECRARDHWGSYWIVVDNLEGVLTALGAT